MSRINLSKAWLFLLLMPAVATAQNDRIDRSRDRGDATRVVEVERSVKRTKAVEKKKGTKRDRVRDDKVSRTPATTQNSGRRDRRSRQTTQPSVERPNERSTKQAARSDKSRNVKDKRVERKEDGHNRVKRGAVKNRAEGHKRVERKAVKHKRAPQSAIKRAVRWATGTRGHRSSDVRHRNHRRPVKRYAYKHRRYHRHNHSGLSIGFYIRIPSIRWHVGHTRRFVFRQVVEGYPIGNVEVQSTLKRKIRGVHHDYVEVEFELDRIAVISAGRFIGEVDRFPGDLRRVRAKIYRDGFVQFDRMLYVVGNEVAGFELLSTRYCGGDVTQASYECLDPRSGDLDFYSEKVHSTGYSRLLDRVQTGSAVSIALVPDEEYSGFQYVVGSGRSSDDYYNGSFDYSSLSRFEGDGTAYRVSGGPEISGFQTADGSEFVNGAGVEDAGFTHESVVAYGRNGGLALQRQTEIQYLDD